MASVCMRPTNGTKKKSDQRGNDNSSGRMTKAEPAMNGKLSKRRQSNEMTENDEQEKG